MKDYTYILQNDKLVEKFEAHLSVTAVLGIAELHQLKGKYEVHHIRIDPENISTLTVHFIKDDHIMGVIWPSVIENDSRIEHYGT